MILPDGNARPHTARPTEELLQTFHWKRLEYPPYSPDLAPSDLKNNLGDCRFDTDDVIIYEVIRWLRQQQKDFFAAGFHGLLRRWDKCLNVQGEYVEKLNKCQKITLFVPQFCFATY